MLLDLPDSIASRRDYAEWLGHFLAFYSPLERAIDAFPGWEHLHPLPEGSFNSQRLIYDLIALECDGQEVANQMTAPCPKLRTFAQALGARYVLEGATLGGKVILRDLQLRIGPEIVGATAFFAGGEPAPSSTWRLFKMAVDRFGDHHPTCREDVLIGAEQTFRALLDWFEPFVVQRKRPGPFAVRAETATPPKVDQVGHKVPAGDLK